MTPILSKYTKVNDPHIILSQQFLVTKCSSPMLICDFIESKINKTSKLYIIFKDFSLDEIENQYYHLIFKMM